DPDALGCWENDVFVLRTQLQKDELVDFFLESYQPSPILGPWGARSGFFPGSSESKARESLEKIETTEDQRLDKIKKTIAEIKNLLKELDLDEKAKDEDKIRLMQVCRSNLSDEILEWLDACYVLLGDDKKFPPLLGTGGNEGSGSYFSGFSQQLVACLINRDFDSALYTSLYGELKQYVFSGHTPGHFSPKSSGGPNSSSYGFEGKLTTNPWDYLLCLEGSYLWASGVFRRYSTSESGIASFPFTVNVSGSGFESLCFNDSKKPQKAKRNIAEIWLPLWKQFISLNELKMLLAEGRASIGRRISINGVDMARAASGLGVDRGIHSFQRISFFMRNGQSFIAVPLGKFDVHFKKDVNLIQEIDPWLSQFRRFCMGDSIQMRFQIALRKIESAIFNYCKYGGQDRMKMILTALGNAERELAVTGDNCFPLSRLSTKWIPAVYEDSSEFQLSLSLAGIYGGEQKIGSIRRNLEPFDENKRSWNENSRENVWSSADLCANLSAVLERRIMDGAREGCQELPLHFRRPASLHAVSAFLAGEVDDQRISDLLWGLILINHWQKYPPLPKSRKPNYS
ncbi:MAG: type I-G CRISPR-associated protein Cas8g1/Csx17, partial [Candidatus Hinthialibacter sp.]